MRRAAVSLILTVLALGLSGTAAAEERFTLLYTASLNGNMDGCTCPGFPRAGLVKRAAALRTLTENGRSLLVDAGDIFDSYADLPLADIILETYRELGYDAAAVGDQEFANGPLALLDRRETVPFLCGNLIVCPDETRCVFFSPAPLFAEKAGLRAAVQAVLDPAAFVLHPGELGASVKLSEPRFAIEVFLELARAERPALTVLLYHGPYEAAREAVRAAAASTGLRPDVVVVGHEQRLIDAETDRGTVYVSPGEEGNRIGMLELSIGDDGPRIVSNRFRLMSYTDDPDDPAAAVRYARYLEGLKRLIRTYEEKELP
jgi:2',3'-cyclic-nucleotide 2'-phosphodiesterase (5'-nucleotidase family)